MTTTRLYTSLTLVCCLLLILSACSQSDNATKQADGTQANSSGEQTTASKTPPADVVRASADPLEIKAGGSAEASVKLKVADGYHINANPPSFPYLIATELKVEPGEGVTAGQPLYPASVTRNFSFSKDGPLAVYEGETAIKLPLTAARNAKKGAQTLKGKLRVQPCDEESCYQPRTLEVQIPLTVN